jgi:hypothetical protein
MLGFVLLAASFANVGPVWGQVLGGGVLTPGASADVPNPLADTTILPGKSLLLELEAKFAKATADGGGKAFATWFAEDGVSLANGQAPVHGRDAIDVDSNRCGDEPHWRHGLHVGSLRWTQPGRGWQCQSDLRPLPYDLAEGTGRQLEGCP